MRSVLCSTLFGVVVFASSASVHAAIDHWGVPRASASTQANVPGSPIASHFQADARQAAVSTSATNDQRLPGTIDSRAEAKARSASFDSVGIYAAVENRRETVFPEGSY